MTKTLNTFNSLDDVKEKLIYQQFDSEAQCRYLNSLFRTIIGNDNSKHLLDLGCGYGRHSLEFAKLGHNIVGIDLNKSAIERARKKAKTLTNVKFINDDICSFKSTQLFDAAYAHNSVMSYFTNPDLFKRALVNIANNLHSSGVFIFDYYYPINLVKQNMYADEVNRITQIGDISLETKSKHSLDITSGIHKAKNFYKLYSKGVSKEFHSFDEMRYWEPQNILDILEVCGFPRVSLVDRDTKQALTNSSLGILVIAGK